MVSSKTASPRADGADVERAGADVAPHVHGARDVLDGLLGSLGAGTKSPTISRAEITPPAKGSALGRIMLSKNSRMRDPPNAGERGDSWRAATAAAVHGMPSPATGSPIRPGCGTGSIPSRLCAQMVSGLKPGMAGAARIPGAPARSLSPRRIILPSRSDETIFDEFEQLIASLSRTRRQAQNPAALQAAGEFRPQSLAAPQDSGLHGPQGDAQNLRDFLVTMSAMSLNTTASRKIGLIRSSAASIMTCCSRSNATSNGDRLLSGIVSFQSRVSFRLHIQIRLAPPMAEKPTPRVVRFVDGDPVNPRFQAALPAEASDIAKDLEKDFLDHVARLPRGRSKGASASA